MGMKVKLWGVRGSLPTPQSTEQIEGRIRTLLTQMREELKDHPDLSVDEFLRTYDGPPIAGYGGNTACVQVSSPNQHLIIDGGSGIRRLGEQLSLGPSGLGKGEIDILMTHFHWDHLVGLPFFTPIFIPGNKVRFYAVQDDLEQNIRSMFQKPRFPVPFDALAADISFHKLAPREPRDFGDFKVTPYQLDHPDPCWGYKIEREGKVFSYCVDTEGKRVSPKDLGPDLPLYQNVDLMVFDAQYTFVEATEKINWGHASGPIGIDLAIREKVKQMLFVHHDPAASDNKIKKAERQTREYYEAQKKLILDAGQPFSEVNWAFATEGATVEL